MNTNVVQGNTNLSVSDWQVAQFEKLEELLAEPLGVETKSLLFTQGILDDVQKAVLKVHSYFPDCPITLRLNERPEESQLVEIWIQACDELTPEFEALDRFDMEWWLHQPIEFREKIIVLLK